jgi:hypothetical protein
MASKRIPSLDYSFYNARSVLREHFGRMPRLRVPSRRRDGHPLPSDVDVLSLLRDTTDNVPTAAQVRTEYERRVGEAGSQLPAYDEALARGWFREMWGGVANAVPIRDYLIHQSPPFADELREFRHWLWTARYVIANKGQHGTASALETSLLDPNGRQKHVASVTPSWVAARLWEESQSPNLALWEFRWWLLGRPRLVPSEVWPAATAQQFREAVIDAAKNGNLPTWKVVSAMDGLATDGDIRRGTETEPKQHLLSQFLVRRGWAGLFETEALDSLLGILVQELAWQEGGDVPSRIARQLVDLALAHPNVHDVVTQFAFREPAALADFMLEPRATALVCYLIASWDSHVHLDRESRDSIGAGFQLPLFEDSLEVLEHFAKNDQVAPEEYAELLVSLQMLDSSRNERYRAELLPPLIERLKNLPATYKSEVLRLLVNNAADGGADSAALAALVRALARTGNTLPPSEIALIVRAYTNSYAGTTYPSLTLIDAEGAGALADMALRHGGTLATSLLDAVDVRARLAANAGEFGTALALRSHLKFLSRAVAGFPGSAPDALVQALVRAIESGGRDQRSSSQVDAFSPDLDVLRRYPQPRLELEIAQALIRLENPAHQDAIVEAILKVEEPVSLAIFLRRVPRHHQDRIRAKLENFPPDYAAPAYTTTQLQHRVTALLEAGLPDAAERFRADQEKRLQNRGALVSPVQRLSTELHLKYLRQDWSGIMSAQLPADLKENEKGEAQHTLEYFKALALLSGDVPEPAKAAAAFDRLFAREPTRGVAVNLLAAHLAKLLPGSPFALLRSDAAKEAEAVLAKVDSLLPVGSLSEEEGAVHYPNRAALLLAIGRHSDALKSLSMVAGPGRSPESAAYEAVADARHGDVARATVLLKMAEEQFGSTRILRAAADYLAGATPQSAPVNLLTQEDRFDQVRSAFGVFAGLPAEEQAQIVSPGAGALERVLTDAMSDALAAFTRLIPFLKLNHSAYHEDELNTMVASLLQAHLSFRFGWHAHDQTFGGFTAKGNPGERDFVVKKGGEELAVYEALRSSGPSDGRILTHFHKLLAYSNTRLFFHITFSYAGDPQKMMEALEELAKNPPGDFSFRGQQAIAPQGSRPPGTRAVYLREGMPVTVFMFLVDMNQKVQRQGVGAPPLANSPPAGTPPPQVATAPAATPLPLSGTSAPPATT